MRFAMMTMLVPVVGLLLDFCCGLAGRMRTAAGRSASGHWSHPMPPGRRANCAGANSGAAVAVVEPGRPGREPDAAALGSLWTMARRGDGRAQYHIALAYLTGACVTKDIEQARRWLTMAADTGHQQARRCLLAIKSDVRRV